MQLNFRTFGNSGDVLLIVHGLYGSMSNWNRLANQFSEHFRVITPDLRNHGRSPWDDNHSYHSMSEDLAELILQVGNGEKAHIIGHSMGGKASMVLALNHPELVNRPIIADIAPVEYAKTEHIEIMAALKSCVDGNFVTRDEFERHLANELKHSEDDPNHKAIRAFLLQNLIKNNNQYDWRINLDTLINYENEIRQWPQFDNQYTDPILFMYGENSDYLLTEHRNGIVDIFPNALFKGIKNAGHWLHAEQPDAFYQAAIRFLNSSLLD